MKIIRAVFLSLGTNKGDKAGNLQKAIDLIDQRAGKIKRIAPVYRTEAWGFSGDDFFNTCVEINTGLEPDKLIDVLLQIEKELGRTRNHTGYTSRVIDIDILLYENKRIDNEKLRIPHPRMHLRKFVLAPLADIAPMQIHPVLHKSIAQLLTACTDTTRIEKTSIKLKKPASLIEKFSYIAIEGNIGSGKTSLALKLSADYNAKTVLERFADNPFLPKFYKDQERYAFPLEMSFLADRYHQLSDDLSQFDLFKNFIVSDYYIFKSLIFAQVTLPEEEFKLYRKMFDLLYKEITKPDVYIYLHQDIGRLLENIKKRGRSYEQNIKPEYLEKIQQAYTNFIKSEPGLNTLVIDVSNLDFVKNEADYRFIVQEILNKG